MYFQIFHKGTVVLNQDSVDYPLVSELLLYACIDIYAIDASYLVEYRGWEYNLYIPRGGER